MKLRFLSLLLILSLIISGNCLELDAATVTLHSEKNTAFVEKELPDTVEWDSLKLHENVYDNIVYEKEIQGPPEAPKIELKEEPSKPRTVNLGTFRVTYYCGCYSCSEGYGNMTATGVRAREGRTIAVDPKVISYGTHVLINGREYVAEDCGGAIKGNDIDIYLEDHDRVYESGVDYYDVYIVRD